MASNATFYVALYGFSQGMVINSGEMFGDNYYMQAGYNSFRGAVRWMSGGSRHDSFPLNFCCVSAGARLPSRPT